MNLIEQNIGNTTNIITACIRINLKCVISQHNPDPIDEEKIWESISKIAPKVKLNEKEFTHAHDATETVYNSNIKRIKELPFLPEVHEWVLSKLPMMEIVRRIKERGYWLEIKDSTCRNYVVAYRNTIPKSILVDRNFHLSKYTPLENKATEALTAATEAVIKFSGHLDKMNQWIEWQHKRLEIAYQKEVQMGFLMSNTHKEFKEARELLRTAIEIKEKLFKNEGDAGPVPLQTAHVEKTLNQYDLDNVYSKEGLNDVLKSPESRMKILNTVDRLMSTYLNIEEAKTNEELDKENFVETKVSEVKTIEEAQEEIKAQTVENSVEIPNGPPIPGDDQWKAIEAEVVYSQVEENKVINPWVDPHYSPEQFIPAKRGPG